MALRTHLLEEALSPGSSLPLSCPSTLARSLDALLHRRFAFHHNSLSFLHSNFMLLRKRLHRLLFTLCPGTGTRTALRTHLLEALSPGSSLPLSCPSTFARSLDVLLH